MKISLVLLAGGQGARFGGETPKQFLPLHNRPVAFHSLEIFSSFPQIQEVILVCAPQYRPLFTPFPHLKFASPGRRRQDSLFHGLQECQHPWIMVHDAARPLITATHVEKLLQACTESPAATLGIPVRSTLKEGCENQFVVKNLCRDTLYEIQTPQIMQKELLIQGFKIAHEQNITVTDDVSLIELLNQKVKIVIGSPLNIKITTPEDILLIKHLLHEIQTNPLL